MKKAVLIFAALGMTLQGIAQDKYVVSALTSLQHNNLDEAKEDIDKAMGNPETKEKPKALFAKSEIYLAMQMADKYKASNPYREAIPTLLKLVETKADYEKETVDQLLLISATLSFNDGVKAYNDKKYPESAELMRNVVKIHDIGGGKRFDKSPYHLKLDTAYSEANTSIANSSFYAGNMDEAIPLLIKAKNSSLRKDPSVYDLLIQAYNTKKNTADAYAVIMEGRKEFPDDVNIRNFELNYYIQSGKQDDLVKKLEEAGVKEPKNADIQFNIATTYLSMANPKDGKKPANAAELSAKAEDAFQRAIALSPDNAGFNYNYGALYYNQATDYNEQMNAITGTSAADTKKYEDLKAKRDAAFVKSTPYFEKAYTSLSADPKSLKGEDMKTYKSSLIALKEVYARQSKMDKSADMKAKLDAIGK